MPEAKGRYFIETFGCQMNANDSERVAGLLRREGYEPAGDAGSADLVFVNTCAVREKAADKLFHALGRLTKLKRRKPGLLIGVGGCVAQLQGHALLDRAPGVDVLVGPRNLARLPELFRQARGGSARNVDLDRRADAFTVPASVVAHSNPVRAYVTVMEGCNHVCSFCVVPRTRGAEVHRPRREILAEVESLVARGFREVMLLGQTVNAYSHDGVDFPELLAQVAAVPGLLRLRFTTSHPTHVDARLANALAAIPGLCPYLHLPVQSGSDRILGSMRRGYSRDEYLAKVALLRERAPGLALSTDVIVGYPGEADEEFEASLGLVEQVGFEGLFSFTYSPRPGTTAERLPDDVPEAEKSRRLQVLNALQQGVQARRNAARIGGVEEILVEAKDRDGRVMGRTPDFRIVHAEGPAELGQLLRVVIDWAGPNSLAGVVAANDSLTKGSADPIL
jgi:tRNA-2-methylthio-N6-dimethylallyladenosine synthase